MTDDLRRQDDIALASINTRLALLEQHQNLAGQTAGARSDSHDRAIEALGIKIDAAVSLWQAVTAEPSASPAGRALLEDVAALRRDVDGIDHRVDDHDAYILRADGALRLAKFALAGSVVAIIVAVLTAVLGP